MGEQWRSRRLAQLVEARTGDAGGDAAAVVVLGAQRCALYGALGVPERDWWSVARWADLTGSGESRAALQAHADTLVADRCRVPGDDVVSDLIAHGTDGEALTADEIRDIVADLLTGGEPPNLGGAGEPPNLGGAG